MATESQSRVLRIQQGQELQFHISRDICCEYSLLNPAYRQAQRALIEILNHTRAFQERVRTSDNEEKELFEFGGNIILFAAPRGGGKTRMMLSFSHVLENPKPDNEFKCLGDLAQSNIPNSKIKSKCTGCTECFPYVDKEEQRWLKECNFFITEPIAPAAMEKEQSILYVVLSRLYRYAEKLLKKHYSNSNTTERQKNDLRKAFYNCLSGINGLKKPSDSAPEDFSILQDISDGLSLRYHFYKLVTNILRIAAPTHKDDHSYLVLQIDDADSKIDGVYEVFEDIRKYLLIPNLVILMSADLDFLHRTITEEHLKRFSTLQNFDAKYAKEYSGELSRVARKYIDKLIPPSHQVNLPELGKMTYPEVKEIRLEYVNKDGEDLLRDAKVGGDANAWTLESSILKLIYQKTGVLFVCPSAYLHNIIPRTHRGINQLMFILNTMENIPPVTHFGHASGSDTKDSFRSDVLAQVEVAQRNLARFTEYFVHDWIKVKIKDSNNRDFLNKFSSTVTSELTSMTLAYFGEKYTELDIPDELHANMNRYTLDHVILTAEAQYRTPDDFLFFFALRTLLTLNSHRLILSEKSKAIQDTSDDQPVVFHYDDHNAFLTNHLELNLEERLTGNPSIGNAWRAYKLTIPTDMIFRYQEVANVMFPPPYIPARERYSSYLNVLLVILQLKKLFPHLEVKAQEPTKVQEVLYKLQEYALMIVANWDVYGKIYRDTANIMISTLESYDSAERTTDHQPLTGATTHIKLKHFLTGVENRLRTYNMGTMASIISMKDIYSMFELLQLPKEQGGGDEGKQSNEVELLSIIDNCLNTPNIEKVHEDNGDTAVDFAREQDEHNLPHKTNVTTSKLYQWQMENAITKLIEILCSHFISEASDHIEKESAQKNDTQIVSSPDDPT